MVGSLESANCELFEYDLIKAREGRQMAKMVIQSIQGEGAQNPGYPGGAAAETAGVRTPCKKSSKSKS